MHKGRLPRLCLTAFLLLWAIQTVYAQQRPAAVYFVSPHGDGRWSGTLAQPNESRTDGPLATLAQAQRAVREAKKSNPNCNYEIRLRGGHYTLMQPLVLGPADSSPEGYRTTFTAHDGEKVTLGSEVKIENWRRPTQQELQQIAPQAREQVWVCDRLPAHPAGRSPWLFKTLYQAESKLPRARSLGFAPEGEYNFYDGPRNILQYPEGTIRNWANATDIEILIRPTNAWVMNILPLAAVDAQKRTATTQINATYPMMRLDPAIDASLQSCWIENALEFLDAPGEWALNTHESKLYLWPEGQASSAPSEIYAPVLTELIRIEGNFNEKGLVTQPAQNISIKNLNFTRTERHTWDAQYRGFQHDWSAVDLPDSAIRLRGARECEVTGCRVSGGAASGIRLDLYAQDNRIEGNEISRLGGHGIALCGYGPGTVNVNKNNIIRNNWIHHVGQEYWHSFAIYAAQSEGNRISHNLIHNVPFVGITLSGSRDMNKANPRYGEGWNCVRWEDFTPQQLQHWTDEYAAGREPWKEFYPYLHSRNNQIEGNDISHCIEKMGDGNAIYLSGAGAGNIVRGNYIHHLLSAGHQTALRPDDLQMGTLFTENIIYQCVWGAVQHKHVNQYTNNIFACILPTNTRGVTWRDWGYFSSLRGPSKGTILKQNIFYSPQAPTVFYTDTKQVGMYEPSHPFSSSMEEIDCDYNLFYTQQDPAWSAEFLQQTKLRGIDANSISADPMFADLKQENFALAPNSPAVEKLHFKPIDQSKIGLEPQWREFLLGNKILKTTITPSGGELPRGVVWKASIACDQPGARIHYTTDGSEPTQASPLFEKPIAITGTLFIRAKSFKEGWLDWREDSAFYLDRYGLRDDFENIAAGARPYLPAIFSETRGTVVVCAEGAAQGRHCLKIEENGGLQLPYNPHLYYTPLSGRGELTLNFDLKINATSELTHQWRQFDTKQLLIGPCFTIKEGTATAGTNQTCRLPYDSWIHVEITAWVGGPKHAQSTVTFSAPSLGRKTFHASFDANIQEINWLGFTSDATGQAEYYLDGIDFKTIPAAQPAAQ